MDISRRPTTGIDKRPRTGAAREQGAVQNLGPELIGAFTSWVAGGTAPAPTVDATGITFANAGNTSYAEFVITTAGETVDNVTYRVSFTIENRTAGSARALVYGATLNHLGATAGQSTNGTFSFDVTTTATGSLTDRIRVQSTATGTSLKITSVSLKRVL